MPCRVLRCNVTRCDGTAAMCRARSAWLLEMGIATDSNVLLILDARDDQRDPVVVQDKRGTSWQHLCNGHGVMLRKRGDAEELVPLSRKQFVSRVTVVFPDAGIGKETHCATHLYRSGRLSVDLRTTSVKSPLETIACLSRTGVWHKRTPVAGGAPGQYTEVPLVYRRVALLVLNSDVLTSSQQAMLRAVR